MQLPAGHTNLAQNSAQSALASSTARISAWACVLEPGSMPLWNGAIGFCPPAHWKQSQGQSFTVAVQVHIKLFLSKSHLTPVVLFGGMTIPTVPLVSQRRVAGQ